MPEHKLVYKEINDKPGFNIGVVLNKKHVKGHIGLEIEVEGNGFPKPPGFEGTHSPKPMPDSKFWSYVHDGSLRGQDNAEYVLTKPIDFDDVEPAVTELYATLEAYGSKLDVSNRTSVHVHLNCQEFHLNRLTSFLCAWFTLEEVLVQWCGEHRVGNLFCLRAVDAPAIVNHIRKFLRTDGAYPLYEILHYGGLNPNALHKHGSVEIRTLRGCTDDPTIVLEWVAILRKLYELSERFEDPRDLVANFSSGGPLSFFDFLLGEKAAVVREVVTWDNNQLAQSVTRGMRFAQDLAFCRDWSEYKPVLIKPDPFNRDLSKIAKKLSGEDMSGPVAGSTLGLEALSDAQAMHSQWQNMVNATMANYMPVDPAPEPDYEPDQDISW